MFRRGSATSRIAKNLVAQPFVVVAKSLIVITGLDPAICRRTCRT
jgi:hypothetical protein